PPSSSPSLLPSLPATLKHALTERYLLASLQHPFIISLHCAFQSPSKLYLLTEYCRGGDLFFHLRRHRRFSLA
ncbi:protein kinase domain containing protein, partial [Nannochloropsis gaditana CCMP526]